MDCTQRLCRHPPARTGGLGGRGVGRWLSRRWPQSIGSVPLWANAAVLLTIGTLLVVGACVPFAALGGLAAGIGLLHGVHAGADMATLPDKLAIAAGVGITAYVFMVVCLATLVWLSRRIEPLRVVTFRAFGSWVVAIAVMLGASELMGH